MEIGPLLKKLSSAAGISGYENEVRQAISEEFGRWADELRTDHLGNLIALKRGERNLSCRSIMLAAHMDEIGLIVTKVEEGFLHFGTVGGFDQRVLPGQEVVVHGRRALPGVIGMRPPHLLSEKEREKVIPLEDLRIDLGLSPAEVKELVRPGDLITMRREFLELGGELVSGQAFDDRAGVAALAVCLENLSELRHTWDVYAVATSQEEVGLRGAMVSAYGLVPDLAIAVDVGFAHSPGLSEAETISLNKGPAIALGPNFHPALYEALVKTAQELEIPYQVEAIPGRSGTDAWAIQVAREGIPTALLSIPLRYMHTVVETVSLKDIERTGRLMAHFIARLNEEFLEALKIQRDPRLMGLPPI